MPRLYFFFLLGMVPLAAQSGLQDGGKVNPDQTPKIVPYTPPGAAILQPGVNAPPPGSPPVLPQLPAAPPVIPKIAEFTISPGTVRQGMMSKYNLATIITLTAPATKDMLCHVVSLDPMKMVATDIKFIKGQNRSWGGIGIKWLNIKHNCKVEFKAYDTANPDVVFSGRLYIYLADNRPVETP